MVNTEWDAAGLDGAIVYGICAMPFVPITDGNFLPENPLRLIQSGNFKKTEVEVTHLSLFLAFNWSV